MDQDIRQSSQQWTGRVRLDIETKFKTVTLDSQSPKIVSPNLPHVIEVSPLKALRTGRLREIRTEPRPTQRIRSNSSGNGPRIPRVSLSPEESIQESSGLRRRQSRKSGDLMALDTPNSHSSRQRPRSRYIISAEHPFKLAWDIFTVLFAIAHMLKTHQDIRDRQFAFGASPFKIFCDVWFFVDILLNFVTERKTREGEILRDHRSICARYLTSWFPIDVLSLFPWETFYVQPIIEIQNKRSPIQKIFFRSKAVIKVILNRLRVRHFRWFGNVAKHTKHHGIGSARLLRLLIKYLPKYILFLKNMKGVVAMRVLRQVHWFRRFFKNIELGDGSTVALSSNGSSNELASQQNDENHSVEIATPRTRLEYEDWELMEDDGVPL